MLRRILVVLFLVIGIGVGFTDENSTAFSVGPFTGSIDLGLGHPPEVICWGPVQGYPSDRTPLNYTVENGYAVQHHTYGPDYVEYTIGAGHVRISLDVYTENVSKYDIGTLDCNDGNPLNWHNRHLPKSDQPVFTSHEISGINATIVIGNTSEYNKMFPEEEIPVLLGAGFLLAPNVACFIRTSGTGDKQLSMISEEFESAIKSFQIKGG